jgi:hypothetical protein
MICRRDADHAGFLSMESTKYRANFANLAEHQISLCKMRRVEGLAGRRIEPADRVARDVDEPPHPDEPPHKSDTPLRHNSAGVHHKDAAAGATRVAARRGDLLLAACVLIGVGLRCWEWLQPRSLWLDEQYIALGIREQPYGRLVGVLPYSQSAPVGWVWLEKFLFSVGGDGERLLRTPALFAGCLGVFAAALLARRLFRSPAAALLTGFVAISPTLVYYSAMVKPYAFDVTATTMLVLLAIRSADSVFQSLAARRPVAPPSPRCAPVQTTPRRCARWAVRSLNAWAFWLTSAIAIWFSQTAAFVVLSCGIVLLANAAVRRAWRQLVTQLVCTAPAVLSAALLYAVHVRHTLGNAWLVSWWSKYFPNSFAPRPLTAVGFAEWTVKVFGGVTHLTLGAANHTLALALLALSAAGAVLLLRADRTVAAVVLSPIVLGYLLALAMVYPMADRVALWLAPLFLVVACVPLDVVGTVLARRRDPRPSTYDSCTRTVVAGVAAVTLAVVVAAFAVPVAQGSAHDRPLERYARTAEALRFVASQANATDLVYVHRHTVPAALWYGPRLGLHWDGRFDVSRVANQCAASPWPTAAGPGTVWLVLGLLANDQATLAAVRDGIGTHGQLVGEWTFYGLSVFRYRAGSGADPAGTCLLRGPRSYS